MAALIKHGLSKNNQNAINSLLSKSTNVSVRYYANKKYKQKLKKVEMPPCRKLKSTEDSIASRGYLRALKSYQPPSDLVVRLEDLYKRIVGKPVDCGDQIVDPTLRYSLFAACYDEFKHGIPNSILHTIKDYDDLMTYYKTPVDTTLPLNKMKSVELPENLHIQYEPVRFLPDEDTMFDGQTAFPKSNTLVTGLRTRRKFKGHKVTEPWPMY